MRYTLLRAQASDGESTMSENQHKYEFELDEDTSIIIHATGYPEAKKAVDELLRYSLNLSEDFEGWDVSYYEHLVDYEPTKFGTEVTSA